MGIMRCSESNFKVAMECMSVLSTNSVNIFAVAVITGPLEIHLCGISPHLMGVNLYHVCECIDGFHCRAVLFGPNAIHLDTINAHRDADIAKNIRIIIIFSNLNKRHKKSNSAKLIQNDYISKNVKKNVKTLERT
tara:strand:- start:443 stop:847 length:405 start_codon:yes stop_codon:yes gene_type:complete